MGLFLALLAFAVFCTFEILQTPSGKQKLVEWIEEASASGDHKLKIGSLDGQFPSSLTLTDVQVSDSQGLWLKIDRLDTRWNPWDLLDGKVKISELSFQMIDIIRKPLPKEPSVASTPNAENGGFPILPVTVEVDYFGAQVIHFRENVLGEDISLSLESDMAYLGLTEGLSFNLAIKRIDQTPGSLEAAVSFLPSNKNLKLNLKTQEPPGGVLVRALNVPEFPEMSAAVEGNGSLEDWQGRFSFHAGENFNLDGTADVKMIASGKYSLGVLMNANIAPLMDPKYREILQDSVVLKSNLIFDSMETINIENLDIENSAFHLDLKGNLNIGHEKIDLRYSVIPKNDQLYQSLAPGLHWKSLKVSGTVEGLLNKPDINLNIDGNSLSQDDFFVSRTNANIKISADRPLSQEGMILAVSANGLIAEPKGKNPAIAQLIPDNLKWNLKSAVHLDLHEIDLHNFDTSINAVNLNLKGRLKEWGRIAKINAEINSPDISKFSEIAKTKLAGDFKLNLDIEAQEFGQIVQAKILSVVNHLDTEFPEVKVIAGDQVSLEGVVRRNKNGMLQVEELKIGGAAVSAVVNATLTEDQKLASKWTFNLPQLARLSKIVNKKLSGQLSVRGTANGAVNSPTVTAKIASRNLIIDGHPVDEARVQFTVGNLLKAPAGKLSTNIRLGELNATTSTNFVLKKNNRLDLKNIKILGLGAEITGDLGVNLKPISVGGVLNGNIQDYTSINKILAQKLSGNTQFQAELSPGAGQTIKFITKVDNFLMEGESPLSVKTGQFSGVVTHALAEPEIKSQLKISGAAHPKAEVEKLILMTHGSIQEMNFDLKAKTGLPDGPSVNLDSTGVLNLNEDSKQLGLNSLTGAVAAIPFKMTEPAVLKISGEDVELKNFIIQIKEGLVASDFNKNSTGIFAKISVDQFPLDLVNQVQPGLGINGTLKGNADFSGNVDDPKGNLEFSVEDLLFAAVSINDLPPASARLNGTWEDSLAKINFLLQQPSVGDFKINGELPLVMVRNPQGLKIPSKAPLKATAEGQMVLDIANNLLMASGNQVKGKVDLMVKVDGVVEKPQLAGTLNLQEGQFENLTLGTMLNAIEMKSTFDLDHFQLSNLKATTPNGGSISAEGTLVKSTDDDFVADFKFSTKSAQLVAIDTVTTQITSDLHLVGPLNSALLKGEIKIDHADIYVPNTLPPSVVVLDVEETEGGAVEGDIKIEEDKKPEDPFELGLDLKIKAPGEIFIRGRGLDTQLEGNLQVTGTSNNPRVDGAFKMRRGTLEILSRKVKFKQGVVGFDGVPEREPNLDFKAEIPAKDITILVDVFGAVSNPKIKLSSNPEQPQDEILANLLFDKSAGAMTPVEALQLANSAAQLAGLGGEGPGFVDKVRGSLGLDTLKLSGDESGPGVEAGRYVAEGVYIGVKQGVLDNSSSAVIEYEVTPNVTVESDIGANSQSRVGVKMEWDY